MNRSDLTAIEGKLRISLFSTLNFNTCTLTFNLTLFVFFRLFEDEEQDLFKDLQSLPRNAALRKLNDLIKRARLAKVHAYIISALRKDMPAVFGKEGKKKELIKNLGQIYDQLQREHQISPGDFPDLKKMQETLQHHDFTKFQPLKPRLIEVVDKMLAEDIARLMAQIPHDEINKPTETVIHGKFRLCVIDLHA